ARPQEYFVGAIALLGADARSKRLGFLGVPDLKETLLAEVPKRKMTLANADISIGIDHARQIPGRARNVLRGGLDSLHLRPLQHRFYDGAEAFLVAIFPNVGNVRIELLVLLQRRPLQ